MQLLWRIITELTEHAHTRKPLLVTQPCPCMTEILDTAKKDEIISCARKSLPTFVYGAHGRGKTTLVNAVAEEMNSKFGQAVYIDCSLYPTANAILREILISLGSIIASKSNYDLTKRLKEKIRKARPTVFLDHFESIKKHDILDILSGLDLCVFIIANSLETYRMMPFNHKAKFANMVEIECFEDNQIEEIIKEKTDGKIDNDSIRTIIAKCNGNLTFALSISKSIQVNKGRLESLELIDINDKPAKNREEDNKVILDILSEKDRLPSGKLYDLYCSKLEFHKSERSFRNLMQGLCNQGLVKSIGDKRGRSYEIAGGFDGRTY